LQAIFAFVAVAGAQQIDWISQVRNKPFLSASDYNFPAQSPSGSISFGNNTITLAPVPFGVNWNDAPGGANTHFLFVSGTGTPEACYIVTAGPGTAISGASAGTLTINCSGAHGAGYTVGSDSGGIQEALIVANGASRVFAPAGVYNTYGGISMLTGLSNYLEGSIGDQLGNGTKINNLGTGNTVSAANIGNKSIVITDLVINGTSASADGLHITGSSTIDLDRIWITNHGGHGFYCYQCYGGVLQNSIIYGQQKHGVYLDQVNNFTVFDNEIQGNGVAGTSNYSGIFIQGNIVGATGDSVIGNDIGANGAGISGFGLGMQNANVQTVTGNFFEANTVFAFWSDNTVFDLTFNGNLLLGNQAYFGAIGGTVHGNTFQGGTNGVQFGSTPRQSLDVLGNTYLSTPAPAYSASNVHEHMDYFCDNAAPSTGAWLLGDICRNTLVSAGAVYGWVNVLAGSPGTWAPFGYALRVVPVTCAFASTTCTVTFSPVFVATPVCSVNDQTAAAPVKSAPATGSVVFTGGTGAGATDVVAGTCTGN
jgi:hypothetical protein